MHRTPRGWRAGTVDDICRMQNGHGFGPEDWDTQGLPIIRIQNLNGGTKFDYYSGKPEPQWLVETGQLLFAWAGTRGVSFGPTIWRGPIGVLNQHIFKIEPKNDINLNWLYWALRYVTNRIEGKAHGFKATLVHVKKSDIDRQLVSVPSLPEQRRIATTLNAWDEANGVAERLLSNSRKQRLALANALLTGRRRLTKGRTWTKRKLSSLIVESRILGTPGNVAKKITVRLYGHGVVAKNEKRSGSDSTQYYRRRAGQFIYSKLDFLNGAFGLIPRELDGYQSTLDLPAFDFQDEVDPRWFLYFVSREDFYSRQLGLASGGRKARRVNPSDLLGLAIHTPTLVEQRAIADAIDIALAIEIGWERFVLLIQQQKHVLMEQLLTGKRRFRDLESAATA